MKRLKSYYMHLRHHQNMERKWIFPLAIGSIVSLFLLFLTAITTSDGMSLFPFYRSFSSFSSKFVETKIHPIPTSNLPPPPRFAYLISGSAGDGSMLKRTLQALYHPNNQYVVHLDRESSDEERLDLSNFVKDHPVFLRFGNVRMITKANLVTYRGPTMVANTLHAAAILLRESGDWDWFINLSASDYPLVTQDDLLHTFSYVPRDLNFIDHTSNIGWKEFQRAKPVIIDPGLYMTKKADVFWITQRRSVPTAFKLFTGMRFRTLNLKNVSFYLLCFYFSDVVSASSIVEPCLPSVIFVTYIFWSNIWSHYAQASRDLSISKQRLKQGYSGKLREREPSLTFLKMITFKEVNSGMIVVYIGPVIIQFWRSVLGSAWMALSRPFIDYTIWGWDNLPRTVLMYYANFISSPEGYFHTVICNAQEFRNTTVNSDLHFISWDNPPKQHPHHLNLADMQRMIDSNAPFARKFPQDDPVLDKIDSELLSRGLGMFTPGGWCVGSRENGTDPCSAIGNITVLRPGPGAKRLETLITTLLSNENFRPRQCK
ncbi:hypothetical protein POTOM_053766 [Populus tomentosa]|uniref:Uncharacterized protein n=1 Tax=Populus tomentosa TaxID=118781 RepID=A0A8X7Y1T4_POPTO|nr:hypothetical protein POTOM_053766 [Populus tomentosa]